MLHSLFNAPVFPVMCACWVMGTLLVSGQSADQAQNRSADLARNQFLRKPATGAASPGGAADQDQAAPKMRADEEFGEQVVLTRRAHVEPWTLGVDTQLFYTDNVALTPRQTLEDTYLRTGFYAQYANRIVKDWFMDASVSSFFFLHDRYDFFDFHLLRAEAGVTRRLPWLNDANASMHYYWFHVADAELSNSIFESHMLSFNLQKMWRVSRGQQFTLGASMDLNLAAQPTGPGRHEFSLYAGHSLRLTEKWTVQAGLRGSYFEYHSLGRADWNAAMTVGVSYAVTSWAKLMFSASGAINRSNQPAFSYDNFVTGVGINLQVSF